MHTLEQQVRELQLTVAAMAIRIEKLEQGRRDILQILVDHQKLHTRTADVIQTLIERLQP